MSTLDQAHELLANGDLEAAAQRFSTIVQADPDCVEALHCLGVWKLREDEPKEAQKLIMRAIALEPNRGEYHQVLGDALFMSGRLPNAIDAYGQAVKLDPELLNGWCNMGLALHYRGEFDIALQCYERALELNAEHGPTLCNLGLWHLERGDYESAVAVYRRATIDGPEDLELGRNLATALINLGRHVEALECYQRVLVVCPDDEDLQKEYVHCLQLHSGQVKPDPIMDAEAWFWRGLAANRRGDHQGALAAYRRCLALDPGHAPGRHLLDGMTGAQPTRPPAGYLEELFANYAKTYDWDMVGDLKYAVPAMMRLVCDTHLNENTMGRVLDLGCGTGLVGSELREISDTLTGVDMSPEMLAKSTSKELYDHLHQDDIVDWLQRDTDRYDLIVSADVLIYFGGLEDVFEGVARCLTPTGKFLFSTEQLNGNGDWKLLDTGRYGHSRDYIRSLAEDNGLNVELVGPVRLRRGGGGWVMGDIYLIGRSEDGQTH